jgi:mono/diheme cytochrome c family protein
MKRGWMLLLAVAAMHAQDAAVERGSRLYTKNCAIPYCHGPGGKAGRAPVLLGHHFSTGSLFKTISWGIPGTGMPEFTSRLKTEEIADLVTYVMTLRGAPAPGAAVTATPALAVAAKLTPEIQQGRGLFFDSGRTGSCGACHELEGWGVSVAPDLAALPPARLTLRDVSSARVKTARPTGGEAPFPVVVVEQTATRWRVYDLSAPLPVLRTFSADQVAMEARTAWRHEQATAAYTQAELEMILSYLRARIR